MARNLWWILWLLSVALPAHAAVHIDVTESSASRLRLAVRLSDAHLARVDVEGAEYHRLQIPGLLQGGQPGLPMLPSLGKWVLLPPSGDATLRVRALERRDLGPARIVPHRSVTKRVAPGASGQTVTEAILESPRYEEFRTRETDLVTLGDPVWTRRQRMAPLTISPAIYDAATAHVQVVTVIEIEITFSDAVNPAPAPGKPDPVVLRTVLNPERAAGWAAFSPGERDSREQWNENARGRWRTPPASRNSAKVGVASVGPLDPSNFSSDEIRIRVDETKLWRISMADLLEDHGFPAQVRRRDVRLYQKRASDTDDAHYPTPIAADVPLYFAGEPNPDDPVSEDDILVFHGLRPEDDAKARLVDFTEFPAATRERPDNFNTDNIYWLVADSTQSWGRMESIALDPAAGPPRSTFHRVDRFEGDRGYQPNPLTIDEPRYHWNESTESVVRRRLALYHPDETRPIDITWTMVRSARDIYPLNIEARLSQGSRPTLTLAERNIGGGEFLTLQPLSHQIPPGSFGDGSLTIALSHILESGQPAYFMGSFLGSVTLEYEAFYRAGPLDQTSFDTGQRGGDVDLEVEGFSNQDVYLFELTDPHDPKAVALSPGNFVSRDGAEVLSLHVPQTPFQRRSFVAAPLLQIDKVPSNRMERDRVFDVVETTGPAQALAIGPSLFADAIQPWLAWRADHDLYGWTYEFVDTQEIYDQFSGGLKSPSAIKAFARYAYLMWDARALLLVGDANENARELGPQTVPDHVPSSLHIQSVDEEELLASDKWYGLFCDDDSDGFCDDYPEALTQGPDMLVGRLPAKDAEELANLIAKIIAYEQPSTEDTWRSRTLWMADDAWSTDYFGSFTDVCYRYRTSEDEFANGQRINAEIAAGSLDHAVSAEVFDLDELIEPAWRIEVECPDGTLGAQRSAVAQQVGTFVVSRLENLLDQGWLWVTYQGHAARNVLTHEALLGWERLANLTNTGRPFIFFGMGCHVSDFLRNTEGTTEAAIGEELVTLPARGAIATYGSSGFEFLEPNRAYMELITRNFFEGAQDPRPPITSDPLVSPWILGEALAQSELDILSVDVQDRETMMAQYNLLGDPLLRVDGAPPRVLASTATGPLGDGASIEAPPDSTSLPLTFALTDHTGVSGVEVEDTAGRSYTSLLRFEESESLRERQASLDLPIHPHAYSVEVRVFDGSYPTVRPAVLRFVVPFEMTVRIDGEEVREGMGNLEIGATASVDLEFQGPVAVAEDDIEVSMDGAAISTPQSTRLDEEGRNWRVEFEIESVTGEEDQAIRLVLAGNETVFTLAVSVQPPLSLSQHFAYPNPTPGFVRFVGHVSRPVDWIEIVVFDLTGHALYRKRTLATGGQEFVVEWDGRDGRGDELANGVYLYRLEVGDGQSAARGDMGRIVFMR